MRGNETTSPMPHIGTEHFVFRRVFRFVSPGRDCAMCCVFFMLAVLRLHRDL